jgi:hypothetical protein
LKQKRRPDWHRKAAQKGKTTMTEIPKPPLRGKPFQADELVSRLNEARDRLDRDTKLGEWAIDLRARLWRAEQRFLFDDFDYDFSSLADEIRSYRRVCRAFRSEATA